MKIKCAILLILLIGSIDLSAQYIRCESESVRNKANQNSEFIALQEAFEAASKSGSIAKSQSIFVIPVVVHVIYKNSTENLSESQIISQIDVLNRDFRLRNADTTNVEAGFSKADVRIEFCLARRDPNGNPTTGINRVPTNESDIGIRNRYYVIQPAWNPDDYLNIWVGDYGDINGNEVLGEATPPGHTPRAQDGVIITTLAFGTEGTATAPYDEGRTTTHEVGHWLNLLHLWGDNANRTCNDGDSIPDTPNQNAIYYNCPANPSVSCATKDMLSNYMGYVDDDCMGNFTEGQKNRMRSALVLMRSSILLSNGCLPVGLEDNQLSSQLRIYPNPADDLIKISLNSKFGSRIHFALYNIEGQPVQSGNIAPGNQIYKLETMALPNGVYLLKIEDGQSQVTKKIILQH